MIIDIPKFISEEKKYWNELEKFLDKFENEPELKLGMEQLKNFHYLYDRTSADLAKIITFTSEPEICQYLESLVSRAFAEIHEVRKKSYKIPAISSQ